MIANRKIHKVIHKATLMYQKQRIRFKILKRLIRTRDSKIILNPVQMLNNSNQGANKMGL